jgi:FlaA1/EpsC-like NDP-sugar epimerase
MESVLIVGAGSGGQLLVQELRDNPRWKLWPVAFVDDDRRKIGRTYNGVPVLGDTDAIPALVRSEAIDVVVIAIPSAPTSARSAMAASAQTTSARVLTMPAIGSILRGEAQVSNLKSVRPVDVLGRPVVDPDRDSCLQFVRGRRVLITGAAGSIGQELSVQIAQLGPERLVLLDTNESGLYDLSLDIRRQSSDVELETVIASVTDARRIERVFQTHQPEIVMHAAAYKHVPAMEAQPDIALETNVVGTDIVVRQAAAHGAERFILVSTDKAVRPTSVMGATKRLAELAVAVVGKETALSVCSVRFGNVLGSRGSVIPTFERQIRAGGPVTVTDPRMKRYFMTIPEAVSLIIQAGAFGHQNVTYILDMGAEVSILDLAKRVIDLHGLRADKDIAIEFTGVRPGEKLYEELTLDFEEAHETDHPKIRLIDGSASNIALEDVPERIAALVSRIMSNDPALARDIHQLIALIDGESPALAGARKPRSAKIFHANQQSDSVKLDPIPAVATNGAVSIVTSASSTTRRHM